jgi:hypothetical protein
MTPNAACYGARRLIHLDPAEISIRSRGRNSKSFRDVVWLNEQSGFTPQPEIERRRVLAPRHLYRFSWPARCALPPEMPDMASPRVPAIGQ